MKIYKLDSEPKRYKGAPALLPLSRTQQFRRYIAKRKLQIALEAYSGRKILHGRQRFFHEWGPLMFVAGIVAVLAVLRHFGIYL